MTLLTGALRRTSEVTPPRDNAIQWSVQSGVRSVEGDFAAPG